MDLRSQKPSTFYGSTVRSYNKTEKPKEEDIADQKNSNDEKKVKVLILLKMDGEN